MEPWQITVLTAIVTATAMIAASPGFWGWLQNRSKPKDAMTRLLLGLAYDKIARDGLSYIERGWITKDEYETFRKDLFEPYKAFGGNGVGERIMEAVSELPLRTPNRYAEIIQNNTKIEEPLK